MTDKMGLMVGHEVTVVPPQEPPEGSIVVDEKGVAWQSSVASGYAKLVKSYGSFVGASVRARLWFPACAPEEPSSLPGLISEDWDGRYMGRTWKELCVLTDKLCVVQVGKLWFSENGHWKTSEDANDE